MIKEKKIKEKIAYCGSQFLTLLGVAGMSLAATAPFSGIQNGELGNVVSGVLAAATLFSAGARSMGEKLKPEWLKKTQSLVLGLSFCGVAAIEGEDITIIQPDPIDKFRTEILSSTPPKEKDNDNTLYYTDVLKQQKKPETVSKEQFQALIKVVDGLSINNTVDNMLKSKLAANDAIFSLKSSQNG